MRKLRVPAGTAGCIPPARQKTAAFAEGSAAFGCEGGFSARKKALSGRFFVPEQRYAPAGLPQRRGAYSAGQPAAAENPALPDSSVIARTDARKKSALRAVFCSRTALCSGGTAAAQGRIFRRTAFRCGESCFLPDSSVIARTMPEKSALRAACRSRIVSCRRGLPQRRRRYSDNGRDCGRCCFCGDLFSPTVPPLWRAALSPAEGAFRAAAEEAALCRRFSGTAKAILFPPARTGRRGHSRYRCRQCPSQKRQPAFPCRLRCG